MLPLIGKGQQDTVFVNEWKMADTLYGELQDHIPTGFLMNRTLMDTTASFAFNAHRKAEYLANADYFYRFMYEMKLMAIDSSQIPSTLELFYSANSYVGERVFEEDRYVYPIGIGDFTFNYLDETYAVQQGLLTKNGLSWNDTDSTDGSAYSTYRAQITAPLFDNYSSESMGLVFKPEYFFSNHKSVDDINTIEIYQGGNWNILNFNEVFNFTADYAESQQLIIRITYHGGERIINDVVINTPEQAIIEQENRSSNVCTYEYQFEEEGNKLSACYIEGCRTSEEETLTKNYIVITGYRPPKLGQSFDKTWKLYNNYHQQLLQNILSTGHDIYLVKFNIHEKPLSHGMQESADLLIKFIEFINATKADKYAENVIQANSMGCFITDLALLKMEKKHFEDNNYPHHHTRLFISYDGDYHGANIPLAYQYQIYSGFLKPAYNLFPLSQIPTAENTFLRVYLYASMEQKAVKELLMYHANANVFLSNDVSISSEPTHHPYRQSFLNALYAVDNGNSAIVPLPNSTRNIAISLGKISGLNSESNTDDVKFKNAGEYWLDFTASPFISKIRASKYTSDYTTLFRRKKVGFNIWPLSLSVDHKVEVKYMQEIDNAPGSYLLDVGNIIKVTSMAYIDATTPFPTNTGKFHFTHKPVVSALAINKNLWPASGSMTLNMQSLGLMYNNRNSSGILVLSNHYGYPNLGRPNDHFSVTPFEAIYVDNNIDPHIVLKDRNQTDLSKLNSFIYNELEPWYLGLQNDVVGAQARPNYIYKSRRMARNGIIVGDSVTPSTDVGEYVVNPNGRLILEAGEYIDFLPGSTFLEGSELTATIYYRSCGGISGRQQGGAHDEGTASFAEIPSRDEEANTTSLYDLQLFPNPTIHGFTLQCNDINTLEAFFIYDFSGNLVWREEEIKSHRTEVRVDLDKGTYLVKVVINGETLHKKLMVL